MDVAETTLSAQEAAIEKSSRIVHGTASDRVVRMFSAMREYGPPRVTLERGLLFTEAFQANEADALVLKWAKALKNYAEKSTVCILDDELIVGRPSTWLGRWAIVYPELDGVIMPDGVKEFKKNKGKIGEVVVTEDDERIIDDILTPYWTGRDYASNFHDAMPEETRFMMFGPDPKDVLTMTLVVAPTEPATLAELDSRLGQAGSWWGQGHPPAGRGEARGPRSPPGHGPQEAIPGSGGHHL